jgi:predicted nucleic-acid-binding protein
MGLDTHVLMRYITQDNPQQSPKATRLIESLDSDKPGYITLVCVLEL